MIKVFCDKCGKEITDNVNTVTEETEAKSYDNTVLMKFAGVSYQYCNECMENELNCGFKVGDEVITSTGQVGRITDICICDKCKERGFYEPKVEVEIGSGVIYITDNDKRVNFRSFYKIGDQVFGNIDEEDLLYDIESTKEQVKQLQLKLIEFEAQLDVVKKIKQTTKQLINKKLINE